MMADTLYFAATATQEMAQNPAIIDMLTEQMLHGLYNEAHKRGLVIDETTIKPSTMPWGSGLRLVVTADTKENE